MTTQHLFTHVPTTLLGIQYCALEFWFAAISYLQSKLTNKANTYNTNACENWWFNPTVFSSVQFIQFHQLHYKSKRPSGHRISCSTLYQTLWQAQFKSAF